jgi:hypothetical protein
VTDIVFENPPKIRRPRSGTANHQAITDALRARPGEWGIVKVAITASAARAAAFQIRNGMIMAYAPEGAYEAAARDVEGEHRVYARFVGGE